MGFQTKVNSQPVPGIAGDFASTNPRTSVIAPPGGYTAAPDYPTPGVGSGIANALIVGRFAWANYATGLMANYFQPASLLGFVHRESQTVITAFLDETRVAVQQGFPVTAHNQGDFWADFSASAPDAAGLSVYADPLTGAASAGAAGQSVALTLTGSIAGNALTVTATSGVITVGQIVQNAALGILPGTYIAGQVSGSAGSTGVYQLSQPNPVIGSGTITAYGLQETKFKLATPVGGPAAFTAALLGTVVPAGAPFAGLTVADGVLTVSAVASGTLAAGMYFAGASIPGFAQILGQLTGGAGGTGTYETNLYALVASESMSANQGSVGKISTWQA